jgi:hypothetical protein
MPRLICLLLCAAALGAQTLDQPQPFRARRVSSFRENGANMDAKTVPPSESFTVMDVRGAGRIVHTWITLAIDDPSYLDNVWIRMYWDGSAEPAVEAPFGDFHALGHGRVAPVNSSLVTVVARPELNFNLSNPNVAGFNTYFAMPYARGAKIVIENRSAQPLRSLYYQVDYQEWPRPPSPLRFHARYSEAAPEPARPGDARFDSVNADGAANHLVLEAAGRGHFLGMVVSVDALRAGWWEGDDMFWIDGEAAPSLHGTGTEDYFGGAWGFRKAYTYPDHGLSYLEKLAYRDAWQAGRYTMYRWHTRDPIPFTKSIKVSLERGHNNSARDSRYWSVAYWYQE